MGSRGVGNEVGYESMVLTAGMGVGNEVDAYGEYEANVNMHLALRPTDSGQ